MTENLRTYAELVEGRSRCCYGLLWVPRAGISKYWICGTCQKPCDRAPAEPAG